MSEVVFCVDCKHFKKTSYEGSCYREATVDLVFGVSSGTHYSCYKERGYDNNYISKSIVNNHEICGVDGRFFEAKQ